VPLPAHRPDEFALIVAHSGFYPRVGRQYGSVQLISRRGKCTEQPCWVVDDAKLDTIYKHLRDRGCLRIASHKPPALPLRPQYRDEHWFSATWKGGACAVEDSDQRMVAEPDRDRFHDCFEAIGVSFNSESRPDGMR
jgi:hypothetical protein